MDLFWLIFDLLMIILLLPWFLRLPFWWRMVTTLFQQGKPTSLNHLENAASTHRFTILVPAHNEEAGIASTILMLKELNYPKNMVEIIVIADNCEDATAEIARQNEVRVFERHDTLNRGKGFALEYAVDRIKIERKIPDAIVVVDADTGVDKQLLKVFDDYLQQGFDWIQSYYTVSNPESSWRTRVMTYALSLFNGVWLLGQDILGMGCALRGNGMCFTWKGLERCPLKSYGLAEDLEFSWTLRVKGEKVKFAPQAIVYGEMVSQAPAAVSQRLRWEVGRRVLRQQFKKQVLSHQHWTWYEKLLYLSDLYMWPLGKMFAWSVIAVIISSIRLLWRDFDFLTIFVGTTLILWLISLGIYAFLPFRIMGLSTKYVKVFYEVPAYFLWKITLIFKRPPKTWVRTSRNQ